MINGTSHNRVCAILTALLLAGCGGGSDGSVAGIDRTGGPATASYGVVTGFGSVIVNGVHFDTSHAVIDVDGRIGAQSDLAVGDVVLVKGSLAAGATSGTADTVTFDDNVEGPIAVIDAAAGTLIVLGQTVRVDADTSFDDSISPPSLAGLAVGDVVEVTGLVASDGSIGATRLDRKPVGGEIELTGIVANHDAATKRFSINAQVVDYSAAQLQDFPSGSIANGQRVEVKAAKLTAGVLDATRVELKPDDLAGAAGDRREIEGFVSRFVSATDFDVAGVRVTTNAQTAFTGGVAGDLGLNVKVEVEGALDSAGTLVATKVDIRRAAAVRIAAQVDSVNAAAGTFVILGITVKVDALTRIEDKSSQQLRPFALTNLNTGDYVEVRGGELPAGGGQVLASRLERENLDNKAELQGFVQVVAQPSFTILGVTIATNGGTQFQDVGDAAISSTAFFSAAAAGSLVKAAGVEVADRALQADEVELED
jgi:hypothetical protein